LGDALHLCAAGGWIGGLLPLTIFLAAAKDRLSLGAHAAHVLRRFSALSLCCVSVLVISGLSNSWLLVGSVRALFTTEYGALLLFKVLLFSLLICSGARNRFVIKTKLLAVPTPSDLLSQLRRNVIYEVCLGTAVVTIVGWLGVTPPPHLGSAPARTPTSASNLALTLVRLLPDQRRDRDPVLVPTIQFDVLKPVRVLDDLHCLPGCTTNSQVMEFAFPRWENCPDRFQSR
jgi:uncharacterized membrane protein